MKCIACGKEFSGDACPHCKFPLYEILGDDMEGSLAQIKGLAEEHQREYLSDVQIGVVTYVWKETDGEIREVSHAPEYFAAGSELLNGEAWSSKRIARIPNAGTLTVKLAVKKGEQTKEVDASISNLKEKELQTIGVRLEEQLQVRVLLKNDSGLAESQPISIVVG